MPAGRTYTPLARTTVSSSVTTVTFSSIPGTYTDLVCIISGNTSASDLRVRFNGDTGSNYSYTRIYGSGTAASSDRASSQTDYFVTIGGFTDANSIMNIQNYSNSTTYKTAITRTNNPGSYVGTYVGLWRSTAAITSIEYRNTGGNINPGSTFTLYGILAA
jgi:hypothetical protein